MVMSCDPYRVEMVANQRGKETFSGSGRGHRQHGHEVRLVFGLLQELPRKQDKLETPP